MPATSEDDYSFDPKTWVSLPRPEAPTRGSAPGGGGDRAALAAIVSVMMLLSGAAAAYLTRTAPPATAPTVAPR